jgi:alpha-methylacyl-CoA racemase
MGPLDGIRVVEVQAMGPAPFCGMVLADLGASVIRVERIPVSGGEYADPVVTDRFGRGKRSIAVDLKRPEGRDVFLDLAGRADVLLEGFRPGVLERLGLGPDVCLTANPRLVFGRMTGWGQDGPLASSAGHDINYISLAGALGAIGRRDGPPVVPLSLVGDFGGGGLLLAFGVCAALVERAGSGRGQVVDAAIVDGASLLMTLVHLLRSDGLWNDERGTNLFDSGAPFYDVYETADGGYISVGAIEPQFYRRFVTALGVDLPPQYDRNAWQAAKTQLAEAFRRRTRDEWCRIFADVDGCVTPVLDIAEATDHPHAVARGSFVDVGGVRQPAPAPRFGRTPPGVPSAPPKPGADTEAVLAELGRSPAAVNRLRAGGAVS